MVLFDTIHLKVTDMETITTQGNSRRGPQWSVRHLLAWTVGCALGFAAYRELSPPWQMPPKSLALSWTYNLIMGSAFGTILTGAGILGYRRWRGDEYYPSLPGHWLLMFGLAAALADAVAFGVFRLLVWAWFPPNGYFPAYRLPYRLGRNGPDLAGMFNQCIGWGLGAVSALAFSWHLRGRVPWHWFAVFLVFLLTSVVLAAGAITVTVLYYGPSRWGPARVWFRNSIHLHSAFILLGALTIGAAAARDLWCQRPTDGLHQAGVAAWLAVALVQTTAYYVIFVYL